MPDYAYIIRLLLALGFTAMAGQTLKDMFYGREISRLEWWVVASTSIALMHLSVEATPVFGSLLANLVAHTTQGMAFFVFLAGPLVTKARQSAPARR